MQYILYVVAFVQFRHFCEICIICTPPFGSLNLKEKVQIMQGNMVSGVCNSGVSHIELNCIKFNCTDQVNFLLPLKGL